MSDSNPPWGSDGPMGGLPGSPPVLAPAETSVDWLAKLKGGLESEMQKIHQMEQLKIKAQAMLIYQRRVRRLLRQADRETTNALLAAGMIKP